MPSQKIGSWTTRIDRFNAQHDTIDYILSPNAQGSRYIFCKKRKFITWQPAVRAINLRYWVAMDYLQQLVKLSKTHSQLTVIVMDDVHLLEAIAGLKGRINASMKLIFSFHGFRLSISSKLQEQVDKVLFLTQLGYDESKNASQGFLPKIAIVGNAVDSKKFYPANSAEKKQLREKLGLNQNSAVFIWMANDRPIKGLAMFQQIAAHYSKVNAQYEFLVIGNAKPYKDDHCTYVGKIPNADLASYLQVGDFYLFTALTEEGFGLSVIEAYKSGNFVIAPKTGALPEVLDGLSNKLFVEDPKDLQEWIAKIEAAVLMSHSPITAAQANAIWPYEAWEQNFLNAITTDL
ncbi:MAG: glycosyltransferase family 4 protein [Gilvibacter sp.]